MLVHVNTEISMHKCLPQFNKNNTEKELRGLSLGHGRQLELIAVSLLPNEVIEQFIAESFCSSAEMVPHSIYTHCHAFRAMLFMLEQKKEING